MRTSLSLFFLFFIFATNANAFNATCKFKAEKLEGIDTLTLEKGLFVLNNSIEIPLEESTIYCGPLGLKERLDGLSEGYQIVLKSCSFDGSFEGHVTDAEKEISADVICDQTL